MDEYRSRNRERQLIRVPHDHSDGQIQFVLNAEEKILKWISERAPVPEILSEICTALDCQIGNIVSRISLSGEDVTATSEIARNAVLFGLHAFFSAGIFAESSEELGSLEIYCCAPRKASPDDIHSIERAAYLAAIAIERDIEEGKKRSWRIPEDGPVREASRKRAVQIN
jgi:hypothetical protein